MWNIIGTKSGDTSGDTEGIVGTGSIVDDTAIGQQKIVQPDGSDFAIDYRTVTVGEFMTNHTDNYLILFSEKPTTFHVSARSDFSLPKMSITASARIGDFTQNISFSEDKSRIFDALKYSVYGEN